MEAFDYVVVGAGSSGCIVAAELSLDPRVRVLVLECGDRSEDHPETLRADGYKDAFINDRVIWERFSVAQPGCRGARLFLGSGRGVGGSGSVNGMVYTRGAREDFDVWPPGWRWDDVAADFHEIERRLRVRPRGDSEFGEAFIAAAEQAGFRRALDLNDGDLSGVVGYETMNYEGDGRRSSYVGFLRDALERDNLELRVGARVLRVLFDEHRATGVEVEVEGAVETVAAREVVLCAGALESPKLLLLSGIGPARELARHGIEAVRDLPGVGANLHDHPNVTLFFLGAREVDSHYPELYGFHRANLETDLPEGQSDTCYVAYPARSSLREAAMRMLPTMLPAWLYGGLTKWLIRRLISFVFWFGFVRRFIRRVYGVVVILGKPQSRGRVRLGSRNPRVQAELDPAYFADPEDLETMLRAVERARAIAGAEPLVAFGNRALIPGAGLTNREELARWIQDNVMTTYHYAGTCRMGSDPDSVVDAELRVRGVEGVVVADASVIPEAPVSAMNAPSMLVGYRAAKLLRARAMSRSPAVDLRAKETMG